MAFGIHVSSSMTVPYFYESTKGKKKSMNFARNSGISQMSTPVLRFQKYIHGVSVCGCRGSTESSHRSFSCGRWRIHTCSNIKYAGG